jgi:hypothetical protein
MTRNSSIQQVVSRDCFRCQKRIYIHKHKVWDDPYFQKPHGNCLRYVTVEEQDQFMMKIISSLDFITRILMEIRDQTKK